MGEHTYFQFPLYALAYGQEPAQRLSEIISFCCVDVGRKESADTTLSEKKDEAKKLENKPAGFNPSNKEHLALAIGMKTLNVNNGDAARILREHNAVCAFVNAMASKHGPSPLVRVRTDIFWEALKGQMDYRRFSVLCGTYAIIGSKDVCRVTRDRIRAGAMGYKTAAMMTAEVLAQRTDSAVPLTENQVRRTLDDLEYSSLIFRVQVSNRKVVFSNRLNRKEIHEKVRASETKRRKKLQDFRKEDNELRASIKAVNCPNRPPRNHHSVTTQSPHNSPLSHRFNKNSLIETSLKETSLIPAGDPANNGLPF